ncbi:zinc finger domain-containing protein [Streptomyces xanthophaeus]
MLDAAYETNRRFRHGAFAEPCPTCHVPPGELCLARRSVHAARRLAHRARGTQTELIPLTAAVTP